MFERFTDRARAVIVGSGELARELRSPAIRRHHVLMALIDAAGEGSDAVASVFEDAEVDRADLRAKLAASLLATEAQTEPTGEKRPFTAETKRTIEVALREALQLGHNYIGREHLLLAILRTADGPLADVLATTKLSREQAGRVVAEKSPPSPGRRRRGAFRDVREMRMRGPFGRRLSPGMQSVFQRAFGHSGNRNATTGDFLVALLETPGTHFASALAGVTLPDNASVRAQVDKLIADGVVDGTEDAVRVDADSGSVTINDPRIADALKKLVGEGAVTPERLQEILRRLQSEA